MARQFFTGFEGQHPATDAGNAFVGSGASIDTAVFRTGLASLKVAAVSGTTGSLAVSFASPGFRRAYIKVSARPATTARSILGGNPTAGVATIKLNVNGTLSYFNGTSSAGSTTTALTDTARWYRVEWRAGTGTSVDLLLIDGVAEVNGTISALSLGTVLGTGDTVADTFTVNYDDVADDDAAFPGPGAIVLLKPTADSAGGTGWRLGTNAALGGNAFGSVDNTPPTGVADLAVGSDPKQIRNATANANDSYDATMTTYTAAGIAPGDTINAMFPVVMTAAPVTTSAKAGTVGVVSNPTIANVSLSAGGTAGAFWAGSTAAAFPSGWKFTNGTMTSSPSVTLGTAPVMRITQVTSSTRIAMVCYMGIVVDYTPLNAIPTGPTTVLQAVGRGTNY